MIAIYFLLLFHVCNNEPAFVESHFECPVPATGTGHFATTYAGASQQDPGSLGPVASEVDSNSCFHLYGLSSNCLAKNASDPTIFSNASLHFTVS